MLDFTLVLISSAGSPIEFVHLLCRAHFLILAVVPCAVVPAAECISACLKDVHCPQVKEPKKTHEIQGIVRMDV